MDKFAYSENNIIGLVLLFIILLDMRSNSKKVKYENKLFSIILYSTGLVMLTDILMIALNGRTGYLLREAHVVIATLHFILSSIPYMTWSIYVDSYIHKNARRTRKRVPIFLIPAAISISLSILSPFNKGIFYITDQNLYHRGDLFLLNLAFYFTYFIATYIQMIKNRNDISKKDYYTLLFFGVIPVVLGLLQFVYSSESFVWLGVSLSVLLIYFNIQNSKINEDYLTGLYNRRQLDNYLNTSIRNLDKKEFLFMIMIDIDDFKKINDTYGHLEGDNALKHTAELFVSTFRADDFIARYAGDEFTIIAKLSHENSAKMLIQRLRKKFDRFNKKNLTPYDINISLGYDIYNPELTMNADEFVMHVDGLMYQEKIKTKK